jgi:hypothetical protein
MNEPNEQAPAGLRQAFATVNTVAVALSIAYVVFLFADPRSGPWSWLGIFATCLAFIGTALQIRAMQAIIDPYNDSKVHFAEAGRLLRIGALLVTSSAVFYAIINS